MAEQTISQAPAEPWYSGIQDWGTQQLQGLPFVGGAFGAQPTPQNLNEWNNLITTGSTGTLPQIPQEGQVAQPAPDTSIADLAAQQGAAATQNSINMYNTQKGNILSSAAEQAQQQGATTYAGGIRDLVYNSGVAQRGIDAKGVQNELTRKQGIQGVLGMVGRGIKSSGVMLANKNAGDSSAAGALADAYGQLGRRQMAGVGNQYAAGAAGIETSQQDLAGQNAQNVRKMGEQRDTIVNTIVNDAQSKLAQLDAAIQGASLPNRIQMEQEKANIRNTALQTLQAYDAELTKGLADIHASTVEQNRAKAQQAMTAGQNLGQDQFHYGTEQPQQTLNTGPFATTNPLFTYRGREDQQQQGL